MMNAHIQDGLYKNPLVSVIALCYNHERFVLQTLESILNQDYFQLEVLIIDNNSSDNSVKKIQDWVDKNEHIRNVKFIVNEINLGVCGALNQALKLINGDFFQFISCDDILLPEKISLQSKLLQESPENVAFIFGDFFFMDENGNIDSSKSFFQKKGFKNQFDLPSGKIKSLLIDNYFLAAPTILYRTSSVLDVGGYDENIPFEDFQMNLRLLDRYTCCGVYQVTCYYRILENSLYNSSSETKISHNYFSTSKYFYHDSITQKWIIILKYLLYNKSVFSRVLSFFVFHIFKLVDRRIIKTYINQSE